MTEPTQPAIPESNLDTNSYPTITYGSKTFGIQAAKGVAAGSASWFWMAAGMSAVNSLFAFQQLHTRLSLGLASTRLVDTVVYYQAELAHTAVSSTARAAHAVVVLLILAGFSLIGWRAHRASSRAFLIGMVLYGLDGLLYLLAQDWVGVISHAVVLYLLTSGYGISKRLEAYASAPPAVSVPNSAVEEASPS